MKTNRWYTFKKYFKDKCLSQVSWLNWIQKCILFERFWLICKMDTYLIENKQANKQINLGC